MSAAVSASDMMFAPSSTLFGLTNPVVLFIIVNMRIIRRTASPALLRDVGLVCLADGIVGVSFGATSVGGGLPWWVPVALSALVFAGGSQIAAVGVVLAGGSPLAAVAAGAVLNTRLLPYGFAVADVVGDKDAGNAARAAGSPERRTALAVHPPAVPRAAVIARGSWPGGGCAGSSART